MQSASGHLVLVLGPSGAGKDTLIDYARARLESDAGFHFVRRVITRPPSAGEEHEPVDIDEFQRRATAGAFALHWQAHGPFYGVPASIDDLLDHGSVVVANGSRSIAPMARQRYPRLRIFNVIVPVEVLAERLAGRGREDELSLKQRLARNDFGPIEGNDVVHIDNAGALEIAGARFVEELRACREADPIPVQ